MLKQKVINHSPAGVEFFKRCCYILLLFELLLSIAHLLWPEYRWGQGRRSYFNFEQSLTLASWLASMQFFAIAVMALINFHRDRSERVYSALSSAWGWLACSLLCIILSFTEMTRIHYRFNLFGSAQSNIYEQVIILFIVFVFLAFLAWFLFYKLRRVPDYQRFVTAWLLAWTLQLLVSRFINIAPYSWRIWLSLTKGLGYLFGCTLLLLAVGGYALSAKKQLKPSLDTQPPQQAPLALGRQRIWILLGLAGVNFALIFLEVILYQFLSISSDYLTANSIISIALLGGAIGGLLGFFAARKLAVQAMVATSLLLAMSILFVFAVSIILMENSLLASILLMAPFICTGAITAIVFVRMNSHLAYFAVLIGSGLGVLLVNPALSNFREEGSMFLLVAFSCLVAVCFILLYQTPRVRSWLMLLAISGAMTFLFIAIENTRYDWFNIVRTVVRQSYPRAQFLFSRSSFVGRYDVVRRKLNSNSFKAYENGRTADTMRPYPEENYQIDPRLPHTLIEDPSILILGLAGDGITKTAKFLSSKVQGVEINPVIVSLQKNELVKYNANSYQGIEVAVIDARSFLEQSSKRYDMITLLNTHFSRGRSRGRQPSPEYLHTREALNSYLEHLTDRGLLIVEEPANRPWREPPVWKFLFTMREVLLERGVKNPQRRFFIFQWKTKTNNYLQILMKKTPFSQQEVDRLKQWLEDVDNILKLEEQRGIRLGPIRTAKTTILHLPTKTYASNVSKIVRGEVTESFLRTHNIKLLTDNAPFMFDVNPAHPTLKKAYTNVLYLVLLILPFLLLLLAKSSPDFFQSLPHLLSVALSGLGYLLVEIVFIQRYELFLGSPVSTFASVVGTLLISSGLGSLASRQIGARGVYLCLGLILLLLFLHQFLVPALFPLAAHLSLPFKICLTVISMLPLGFLLGVPFPFILRSAKANIANSAASVLYASNAATSALAVPLVFNLSTNWGFSYTFLVGMFIYAVVWFLIVGICRCSIRRTASGFAVLAISLLFISPWLARKPVASQTKGLTPDYKLYALSYGRSYVAKDKIFSRGSAKSKVSFEWMFWVIKGGGKVILVDSGFNDPELAKKWGISNYVSPIDRLKQLGISPSDVSDIIITHAHWDHVGLLEAYQNAKIWIQEKEYDYAQLILDSAQSKKKGMRKKDLRALLAAEQQGRLQLVDGQTRLAPGITMSLAGGHTPGAQYVTLNTLDGQVVIAGDNTYMYKNNQAHVPIGSAYDQQANLAVIKQMHTQAGSPFLIIPGHDPRVVDYFPEVSEGIVEITTLEQ